MKVTKKTVTSQAERGVLDPTGKEVKCALAEVAVATAASREEAFTECQIEGFYNDAVIALEFLLERALEEHREAGILLRQTAENLIQSVVNMP